MNCKGINTQEVCLRMADGSKVSAVAHYEYGIDVDAAVLLASTRFTDPSGVVIDTSAAEEISVGVCPVDVVCVESQEWTYGIDNTGTATQYDAILCIELSDGSTIEIDQTNQGTSQWTPQMQEWGDNIQAAADAAGILWFVDVRYRVPSDPSNLSGGGGFSGPPSLAISNNLTNMLWRYVNIQICPGQPVPTAATWKRLDANGDIDQEVVMTTDGAVLGPLQKFWMCTECGRDPVWYLDDSVTLAEAGQIPNCWEPCGTLALADAPPDRACEFFFAEACDNVGEPDFDDNWVELVTRRATVCSGEQIAVDYFIPDAADPTALVDYTLIGEFVDCDTGEPIPEPEPILPDPAGAHEVCFESSVEKKAGYDVSDFDAGDLDIGDSASCTFSLQVDDPNPTYYISPISGYTFVDNGGGNFTANFIWTGASNPEQLLQATATLSTGETAVISGTDFYLCSGAGESLLLEFTGEQRLKEICYENFPSVFQDEAGNVVDATELVRCKPKDRLIVPDCVKKRTFTVGYDNGSTPGSSVNDCGESANLVHFQDDFEVLGWLVNGSEVGAGELLGGFTTWTPQLQGWADFFNAFDPNANSTATFGRLTAPTWRFTEITGCDPTAVYGPLRLKRVSDGCIYTIYPVEALASESTEMLQKYVKVDCDDVKETVWCGMDDLPVSTPDNIECFVPCAFSYDSFLDIADAPVCTEVVKDLCDVVDAQSVAEFVLVLTTCDGVRTRERWTADSYATAEDPDGLVAYTVVGTVSNCDTLEPYVEPPLPCEDFEIIDLFSMTELSGNLRSREWILGEGTNTLMTEAMGKDIRESFDLTDTNTVSDVDWGSGLDVNDSDNTADFQDMQVVDGYMLVDKAMLLRWSGASAGYIAVEIDRCCTGDYELVLEGAYVDGTHNPTSTISIDAGLQGIRIWNIDDYVNSARVVEASFDGGLTWEGANIPTGVTLSRDKPTEYVKKVKVCKPSGVFMDLFTDAELDKADCYCESKICSSSIGVWSGC